ncbi:phosphatidylserine decarboxylase-domain-containing protein [Mycena floridula]|nr:phosphatidylserine decarboxylase-domain-containing protein [Mycena floridula]
MNDHMHNTTPASQLTKPVASPDPSHLPDATKEQMASGLEALVSKTAEQHTEDEPKDPHSQGIFDHPWLKRLIPGIEKLAASHHFGNFVVTRGIVLQDGSRATGERIFESMPIYARIGMHLLFYGREQQKLVENDYIEGVLRAQSIKQGKIYDAAVSVASIPAFVTTYSINLEELLLPDISSYKTFNEFFYRKLKPGARTIEQADIVSAADCRLTVYPNIDLAKKFWVKGDEFTLPRLLNVDESSPLAQEFNGSSLAIFRLAPADYHRFHCPIDGVIGSESVTNIDGQYYTVNPQAINEVDFDVFTANIRSILYITHKGTGKRIAFIAIGAMLVGSIVWTGGAAPGEVKRGDELGYFKYGGSTVIALLPPGIVEFDKDLLKNSEEPVETLVKVGMSIGRTPV